LKKIIIIGGGIAGLSTGCYARMNGFHTEIYEMNPTPGGVCTSWKRGDYLFDHCLHWVLGSNKGTNLYPVFKELGVADHIEFHYAERFRAVTLNDKTLTVYSDTYKFKAELLHLFPEEKKGINRYIRLIKKYTKFNPPMDGDFGNFGFIDMIKLFPFMPSFIRLKSISIEDFLNKLFKNRELIEMLFQLFSVQKLPALMAIMPLSFMHKKEGGYPLGGSLNFSRTIERRYLELGGIIHYRCKVGKIIVEDGYAKGIELDNHQVIASDIIISACDGHSIIYNMLEGKYLTDRIRKFYEKPSLWKPIISISLGINCDFSAEPEIVNFKLKEPVFIGGKEISWTGFFHYCHDPNFAPKGKSFIKTQIETDYFYWKNLYEKDRGAYYREKDKVLETYIQILNDKFPGIREDIEVTDVATPVTWERYTGNWQGSYEGWSPTVETFGVTLPKKLPGLRDFYMTGQWVFPGGGVPMCMAQGKNLIKMIVKQEKKAHH
jgi:phytoene dehydrogenase-like protein